ncbi:SGNH/GDSL hydrolase family protein [Flavobacterium sp. GA093]|uniref:SGNH/GDSL hydrolase family protein n=1 Tax=Flavobacterium hydrocarbonoxydans TaxID=2683249 RepID=A0A6I4NN51_9FLAO|nr:SGNH/GDSL hydrolase family protein [Flavobacterium hydrocarbonoxydans]MWB95858.1 SGNH/GDSL hydrolase family protein [Flavobacterium hydrocarbonoxydans]
MTPYFRQIVTLLLSVFLFSCSSDEPITKKTTTPPVVTPPTTPTVPTLPIAGTVNYLALGDSYTIGQSVCETCRYPAQLVKKLNSTYSNTTFPLKIIATTGWTTTNLLSAINSQKLEPNYDLVTLLIGVNNQYQGREFSLYEKEFPELVLKAIALARGNKKKVVVISIPDYAYTPYGAKVATDQSMTITNEINKYNAFAENYCNNNGIAFVPITDITRQGLNNPSLVATDGLHPSELAYTLFVDRMLPQIKAALQD